MVCVIAYINMFCINVLICINIICLITYINMLCINVLICINIICLIAYINMFCSHIHPRDISGLIFWPFNYWAVLHTSKPGETRLGCVTRLGSLIKQYRLFQISKQLLKWVTESQLTDSQHSNFKIKLYSILALNELLFFIKQ